MSLKIELEFGYNYAMYNLDGEMQNQENMIDNVSDQVFCLAAKLKADECFKSNYDLIRLNRGKFSDTNCDNWLEEVYPVQKFTVRKTKHIKYEIVIRYLDEDNTKEKIFAEILKLNPQPNSVKIT